MLWFRLLLPIVPLFRFPTLRHLQLILLFLPNQQLPNQQRQILQKTPLFPGTLLCHLLTAEAFLRLHLRSSLTSKWQLQSSVAE